jgi:uncharacterized protein (TIGR02996 family)
VTLPAELEAAIVAAPDEPTPYLVAADWLQARGDLQGELIALMQGLDHEQNPAHFLARKQRREELLRVHGERWLGGTRPEAVVWRWGFVARAQVEAEQVEAFLSSRAGRFVRELEVRGPLDTVAETLARVRPRVVRGLALVGGPRTPAVQLSAVVSDLPLERLGLVSVAADFTGVDPHRLVDLRLRDVQHPTLSPFLNRLAGPALRHLELCLDASLATKTAVVARQPALTSLHLEDDLADDLAGWAASAAVIKQLDALSLCGPMTDRGLDALLLEASRLSRLKALALAGGHFTAGPRRLAYKQLPRIVFHKSRTPWAFW